MRRNCQIDARMAARSDLLLVHLVSFYTLKLYNINIELTLAFHYCFSSRSRKEEGHKIIFLFLLIFYNLERAKNLIKEYNFFS